MRNVCLQTPGELKIGGFFKLAESLVIKMGMKQIE
jgi:hypothetical protein